jgi:flagellar motility protein MotE (MotC chaperone)
MKNKVILFALFSSLLLTLFWAVSGISASYYSSFSDVGSHHDPLYAPYIEKLFENKLITGDTNLDGTLAYSYRPDEPISRAEFTKVAVGIKLAEKYGLEENWSENSDYGMTESILKDKLLYFHQCDNSDLSDCHALCSADICGVCNVCTLIGEKPFVDVPEKSRDCEDEEVCTPWYTEYVYYAQRKGMVKGYRQGDSYRFEPNSPILRIHGLKLVMADNGNVDPEADERFRRLSQTARARGSYFPKCLAGAEQFILQNNGGEGFPDAEKLLEYALYADRLDMFGSTCQVFSEAGAYTPKERAEFLQRPMSRKEVARYFVLSTNYAPLMISPFDDDTVNGIVNGLENPESIVTETVNEAGEIVRDFSDITVKVYEDEGAIPIQDIAPPGSPFDSTFNREACIFNEKTFLCHEPNMSNCFDVPIGSRVHTTEEDFYGRPPQGYYTWLWHGVIYQSIGYYAPLDDIDFDCEKTLAWEEAKRQAEAEYQRAMRAYRQQQADRQQQINAARAAYEEAERIRIYGNPDCGVSMSCDPIQHIDISFHPHAELCGESMSCGIPGVDFPAPMSMPEVKNYCTDEDRMKYVNGTYITMPTGKERSEDEVHRLDKPLPPAGNNLFLQGVYWFHDNVAKPTNDFVYNNVMKPVDEGIKSTASTVKNGLDNGLQLMDAAGTYMIYESGFVPESMQERLEGELINYVYTTKGVLNTVSNEVGGLYDAATNPAQTLQGVSYAVTHPSETYNAIVDSGYEYVEDFCSGTKRECVQQKAELVTGTGLAVVPGGLVFKGAKVTRTAKWLNKLDDVNDIRKVADGVEDVVELGGAMNKVDDIKKVQTVLESVPVKKGAGIVSEMQPRKAAQALTKSNSGDVARILDKMVDPKKAQAIVKELDSVKASEVLSKMNPAKAANILKEMDPQVAAGIIRRAHNSKAARMLEKMHIEEAAKILSKYDDIDRVAKILNEMKDPLYASKQAFYRSRKTEVDQLVVEYRTMVVENQVEEKLRAIATKYGVKLNWKDSLFKDPYRVAEKAFTDYGGDISQVKDIFRTRFIIHYNDYASGKYLQLQKEVEQLFDGLERSSINNFQKKTRSGYRNLLMNPKIGDKPFEIQITVEELFDANDATHDFIKAERKFKAIEFVNEDIMKIIKQYGDEIPQKTDEMENLMRRMTDTAKVINEAAWEAAEKSSNLN